MRSNGGNDMSSEDIDEGGTRYTRRQALGRMSAVATTGAVAWVVPEILTAEPAGASVSAGPNNPGGGGSGGGGGTTGVSTSPSTGGAVSQPASTNGSGTTGGAIPLPPTSSPLAVTGTDLLRDAEIGAAMVAGGWALHRWTSRGPTRAVVERGEPDATASQGDPP
jgi:hypothetical protein